MRKWFERLWNVLRPGRLDRDLEREMRFHVLERIDVLAFVHGYKQWL